MMDYALRRRFSFYSVKPAFENDKFKAYLHNIINDTSIVNKVIERLADLNKKIADEDNSGLGEGFCIGHSYFCTNVTINDEWLKSVVEFELIPLLKEYWFDEPTKVKMWTNHLREVLK
jgi:5-methylcytosine-specific restriction protein B